MSRSALWFQKYITSCLKIALTRQGECDAHVLNFWWICIFWNDKILLNMQTLKCIIIRHPFAQRCSPPITGEVGSDMTRHCACRCLKPSASIVLTTKVLSVVLWLAMAPIRYPYPPMLSLKPFHPVHSILTDLLTWTGHNIIYKTKTY